MYQSSLNQTVIGDTYTHLRQGRHGEFELGKAQYSTPIFVDQLFLIRAY